MYKRENKFSYVHGFYSWKLLEVLPVRTKCIINDLLEEKKNRTTPKSVDRLLSKLGQLNKNGFKAFGKKIKKNENCNNCGWCVRHCPSDNIKMEAGGSVFMDQCYMCLNCIYGCPQKALQPGKAKFMGIKEGYSLKALEKQVLYSQPVDIGGLAKGYLWKGVKKYLLNEYE